MVAIVRVRRGVTERPHATTPPVADARRIGEDARLRHPIVESPICLQCALEEREIDLGEVVQLGRLVGLAHHQDQCPRDVVDAVAVVAAWRGVVGVLEDAAVIGQRRQVRV